MSLLTSMPHVATIQTRTVTAGLMGGSVESFTTRETGIAAWVQPASAAEIDRFERRGFRVDFKMFFKEDPGVSETDQVILDGVRYEFRAFSDRGAGLGRLFAAFVETVSDRT